MTRQATLTALCLTALLGCGGSRVEETRFNVSGKVASTTVQVTSLGVTRPATVSHVLAVSASGTAPERRIVEVAADGTFKLGLLGGKPYAVVFLDQKRTGEHMILAALRLGKYDLNTIAPRSASGLADMGTVSIDTTEKIATMSTDEATFVAALGLDEATATSFGMADDLALRYSNPDIDADGTIDALQGRTFLVDYHVGYELRRNDKAVSVDDILGSHLPADASIGMHYTGTGVYAAWGPEFSGEEAGEFKWVNPMNRTIITKEGGPLKTDTFTRAVTANSLPGLKGFGPTTTPESQLPNRKLVYRVGGKDLIFVGVETPTVIQIKEAVGRIVPFVRLNAKEGKLSSLQYTWMKKSADGWVPATSTELALILDAAPGTFRFQLAGDPKKVVTFHIASGPGRTVPVKEATATDDAPAPAEGSYDIAELCRATVDYADAFGFRYSFPVAPAAGNRCP